MKIMKNMKKQGKKHFSGKGLSIKQKVTLWYACMLVLIVLLLFGFIFSISRSLLQRESDSRLEEVVLDFVDDIDFENGSYELDDDIRFYEDGVIFSIYDEQGRLIAGSVPTNFPADTVLKAYSFQTFSTGESTWSVYDAALSQGGQILWIRGILPSETLFSVERTMLLVLLIACPLLIAVALLVGYSITRRAFLPIEEIRQTAETIGAGGDLSARIPTERTQGEIRQLADTFNEMFERLETSFVHERQVTSDASHELRTPLTAIRGWGETLMQEPAPDPETLRKGMHVIINETERLSSMVEELLDFSRLQGGRLKLEMERMDAVAELSDAVLMFTERARQENKTLTYEEPEFFAPVTGDHNRLRQVFVNILDNALKYSDPGDSVTVTTQLSEGQFVVCVSDTGVGISSEDLPKIKTKFFKGKTTRRGSGIGLAVADEIIAMHGGSLELSSQKDVGTTVRITLPLAK